MTFKELQNEMTKAMKEKNRIRKTVIADMIACAKNMAIEQGCKDNITDEITVAAILKSKKVCQEQIDTCPANRPDILEGYKVCMGYINELAPKMMSEQEIYNIVQDAFLNIAMKNTALNKGTLMKAVMPRLKGKADGKVISKIVDSVLK